MKLNFWHILFAFFLCFALAYYFIPFVRYLLIPFSGGTKAPDSLIVRFLDLHVAIDAQESKRILANELDPVESIEQVPTQSGWINSLPLDLQQLYAHNKCVLIYFWNLSCLKCIQSIPYVQTLWDRYKDAGLIVIGVHTPSFDFENAPAALLAAVEKANITFPVVTDGNKKIWNKFGNHFRPAMYLINPQGVIIYTNFGQGNYAQQEHAVREALKKAGNQLPQIIQTSDYLEPIIRRSTQEVYAGAKRFKKPYGNPEQPQKKQTVLFSMPKKNEPDILYVEGMHTCAADYIQNLTPATYSIDYLANTPYAILAPANCNEPLDVEILLDNEPVKTEFQGADLVEKDARTIMAVKQSRLYYPISNKAPYGRHTLTIKAPPGLRFYSFNFGTY